MPKFFLSHLFSIKQNGKPLVFLWVKTGACDHSLVVR